MAEKIEAMESTFISLRDDLLDMTLRNRLLNFRPRKISIEIVDEDIAELYQLLVIDNNQMSFLDNSKLDENILEHETWSANSKVKDSHKDLFLQTNYDSDELQRKLKKLYNKNKINLEEKGYNTLFLALGFLEWTDSNQSGGTISRAPLILVPMHIIRPNVASKIKVAWNSDEIKSNISLQYKLQEQSINFPIFEDIESKEELIDYLKQIEAAIKTKSEWKISKDIYLSDFSFKKFVMFKDLDPKNWNNLTTSGLSSLYSSESTSNADEYEESENSFEKSIEMYNVVDADSSQIETIKEIKKDNNLVVEGPPGTGKSQTIVNIIAELLANNKKILFVSEKKAALDVVKSRLDSVGLGEACLELHGPNSNKKEVLEELKRTLESGSTELANDKDYFELDNVNKDLIQYANTLHKEYGETELTYYNLIGLLAFNMQYLEYNNHELLNINLDDVSKINLKERGQIINNLKQIKTYYNLIAPVSLRPWRLTAPEDISSPQIKEITAYLNEIQEKLNHFIKANKEINNLIGVEELKTLDISNLLNKVTILKPNLKLLKDEDDLDELIQSISSFQEKSKNMDLNVLDLDLKELKVKINKLTTDINKLNINSEILNKEDLNSLMVDFKSNKNYIEESNLDLALKQPDLIENLKIFEAKKDSFTRHFSSKFKGIKKQFKSYYTYEVSDNQICEDFNNLIKANNDLTRLRNKISAYCEKETTDDKIIIEAENLINWVKDLDNIRLELNKYNITVQNNILGNKIDILIELKELLQIIEDKESIGEYYFNTNWKSHKSNISRLKNDLKNIKSFKKEYDEGFFNNKTIEFINQNKFDELDILVSDIKEHNLIVIEIYNKLDTFLSFKEEIGIKNIKQANINNLSQIITDFIKDIDKLNDYRLYAKYSNKYSNEYTEELINELHKDNINPECIENLFYYTFANNALKDIFTNETCLDEFNYKLHENKIEEFRKLDNEILELNRIRIKEILNNNRPVSINASRDSSLGILKKEMNKKRRLMSIRNLLIQAADVITSLKPCFMMSPMSIAQYLTPKIFESYFDYIIFDEASQVKVADAFGAMLRGKHFVIMGDTKQLPPTTFFEKETVIDEEDSEYDDSRDLESILHLCKSKYPTKMLKWHYRSRHESLISVSNMEFYNNNLYVFPSPMKKSEDLGLKFQYDPLTVYDRGKSTQNIKEAENVIEYALNCAIKYGKSKSLGIGTFSIKQQQAIEDVLETKLKEHPELEEFFNESEEEGFFIKNLENIQGDERDIILISMGYGKDINRKLNLNFGPLNKEGGERRLNVLISRAKEQCVVFTNFKSSEMHTESSTPIGVKALKTFLYFAETGEFPANYHTGEDFDSHFEESVYNFLTDEGYIVEKQIGCAGYKIDLAIVDKEDADRYILAIECDGATYHSSYKARDNDRLRQKVLENLGWSFYRIWSTDWYHSRTSTKERLLNAIEKAIRNKANVKIAKEYETNLESYIITKTQEEKIEENLNQYFTDYKYFNNFSYSVDDINNIENLIKIESPIHIEEIYNRVKTHYCLKQTKSFEKSINIKISNLLYQGKIANKKSFYYTTKFNEEDFKVRCREKPNIKYISNDEIEMAIIATLKIQYSSTKQDLIKYASTKLGFKSLRVNTKEKFEEIIQRMKNMEKLTENNTIIQLNKNKT